MKPLYMGVIELLSGETTQVGCITPQNLTARVLHKVNQIERRKFSVNFAFFNYVSTYKKNTHMHIHIQLLM